ncbi:hypothetical protein [Granulicella sibirica]|uniref:Uncharacterized protein n=1 Tax=Granulicella sibirica TaxID=2479048 RepID=A0A4Q0T5U8_9BACT|nr:hypothetical protein [Granulicella sibirica]RXH57468.1 hypothetical protein GRAN_0778 [Granulicella sibirica]
MTDMFFPSVLIFAAISLVFALLPQYDSCTHLLCRLRKSLSDRLHKHA